ncbi:hypothetical protein ES703_101114 [subsurface metagenome]
MEVVLAIGVRRLHRLNLAKGRQLLGGLCPGSPKGCEATFWGVLRVRWACKPNSVEGGHLSSASALPRASCSLPEGSGPTSSRRAAAPLLGLAPGGVYRALDVTTQAVRSYRTFSPLPAGTGGMFSVALVKGCPFRLLAGTLPCGVRTFLSAPKAERPPGPPDKSILASA